MLYFDKLNIFKIDKEMKNDNMTKSNYEDRQFTFKITKRRSPWTTEVTILANY
jgi:hypothetical protein